MVVLVSAALLAVRLLPDEKGRAVAWSDLSAQTGPLTIRSSQRRVFRKPSSLARYLEETGARKPVPAVDFSDRQLLLVSPGPRSSSGYAVEVLSAREADGEITVRVRERSPGLNDRVQPRLTHPYLLISLPAGPEVYVDWVGR